MRFLALGDSYTIGEGVAEVERWPNQLTRMLRERGMQVDDPHLIARTAWTTDELADAIDAEPPVGKYDLVSMLIGVNDQYRSRPVSSFAPEFERLLKRARGFIRQRNASRLIVLSIPDWGATPFAEGRDRARIGGDIAAYNASARASTVAIGARWVDIVDITRSMQHSPVLVTSDGLHPSGEMYRLWAELVLPGAMEALQKPRRALPSRR